jgi:uncharacterized membrane protein YphA (DoxX/SURF4 family)
MDTALLVLRLILAAVFLVAGLAKLADLQGAREAVAGFGVPERLARPLGTALPGLELATALALLLSSTAWAGALAAALLLTGFCTAIAHSIRRGSAPACHCFGQVHSEPVGPRTLVRNLALLALAVAVLALGAGRAMTSATGWLGRLDATSALALALGVVVCAAAGAGYALLRQNGRLLLRIDELEARTGPAGRRQPAHGLAVGTIAPPVGLDWPDGPLALVFVDPGCGPCGLVLDRLAERPERPDIVVISPRPVTQPAGRIALDPDGAIQRAYLIPGTPAAVAVDAEHRIASPPAAGPDGVAALIAGLQLPMHVATG